MSNKLDLHSQHVALKCLAPVVVSDNTAQVGSTIDTQGYDAVEFIIQSGVLADADATFDVALYEGDASNMSDETEVTSADSLYGSVTDFIFSDDGLIWQVGYRGAKRYLRLKITPAANTGSAPLSACCIARKKKVGTL